MSARLPDTARGLTNPNGNPSMMPMQVRVKRSLRAFALAWKGEVAWTKVGFVALTGAPAIVAKDGAMRFTDSALAKIYFGPVTAESIGLSTH